MTVGECSCNEDGLFFPSALKNADYFIFFGSSRLLVVGKIAVVALLVSCVRQECSHLLVA